MTSFTTLLRAVSAADYTTANQLFRDIMEQLVANRLEAEKKTVLSSLTEAPQVFAVVAIDDPARSGQTPAWKRGPGYTSNQSVVWQMWGLASHEVIDAAKLARQKHPLATISVENAAGRIVKVFKPGERIAEATGLVDKKNETHV